RVREAPRGDDEEDRRREPRHDDADGAHRDGEEPTDEPTGAGDRPVPGERTRRDAHETSRLTSMTTRTRRNTITTLLSVRSGKRAALVLPRQRRMLRRLEKIATMPTTTPTAGAAPPPHPSRRRTH